MPPALRATLFVAAERLRAMRDPWWIITGAAVVLHGGATEVGDVDVLTSPADAVRLLGPTAAIGMPSERYRSAVFGTIAGSPLPIEIMAGFALLVDARWQPVQFATREAVTLDGATLFVPGRKELVALLRTLGRRKDMDRAVMLAS